MVDEPAPPVNGHSAANGSRVQLNAMPSAKGLQVAFPAEVLAEALRPLVASWVAENLPDVVERLVREELTRLAER
jgi:cell pole-organizing protein PopZ